MRAATKVWNGKTITKPGVYSHVPLEAYHSQTILDGPSISSTQLRRVLETNGGSPAHMWSEWSGNPDCARIESADLILGAATHHLLLGQGDFAQQFVIRPDRIPDKHEIGMREWSSNATVCREWMEVAKGGGFRWNARASRWVEDPKQGPLTVISGKDVDAIRGMASAIARNPEARAALSGQVERSLFWRDKPTGLWLKARPDAVPTDSGDFCDLKTCRTVNGGLLRHFVSEHAYHQQAALVIEGAAACAGVEFNSYSFVFVEKTPPYCVRVMVLENEDIDIGAQQNRDAIDLIARCIERGEWPGPGEGLIGEVGLSARYRAEAKRAAGEAHD